ncbi:hypothetical protein ZWY2020_002912 [Hordeum vulgare]|nr:hypothetical protein ZWY2020_002912 [Hordeum vulgare]
MEHREMDRGGSPLSHLAPCNPPGKIVAFNNLLFDLSSSVVSSRLLSMSFDGDAGEGGEAPIHPKSLDDDTIGDGTVTRVLIVPTQEFVHNNNWDEREAVGQDGPNVRIDGEVHLDDDIVVEDEPVMGRVVSLPWWRLLRRYVSIGRPNIDNMAEHFSKVWKVRTCLDIARIKNNWYLVTLFSEEDYNFVARG